MDKTKFDQRKIFFCCQLITRFVLLYVHHKLYETIRNLQLLANRK